MQLQELPPEYLAEIARQLSFVSAFLGGFAATFVGTLLFAPSDTRTGRWAVAFAALSACAFIVSVLSLTMLAVGLHPNAPAAVIESGAMVKARLVGILAMLLGMYALLVGIGLSGFMRSRRLGWITSTIALAAALIATWTVAS